MDLIREHFKSSPVPRGCRYWCEKTPRNILFFREISACLGHRTKMINIVRDGRDVVCSVHPDAPERFWVSPERWVEDVAAGIAFEDDPQVLTLRYEDLVTAFAETMSRLCAFLKLRSNRRMLEYPAHATLKVSNAWSQPASAVHANRIGSWRTVRGNVRVAELLDNPDAVRLLHHFNYI